MANFVHLTPEKNVSAILRGGIRAQRVRAECGTGVYAMPVVPNFYTSHQWLRELKRSGQRTFWAIYFHLDDDDIVSVGHYNRPHTTMSAVQAAGLLMRAGDVRGYEVIIPHGIERKRIYRVKRLPHLLGWRYFPDSHQRQPCGCPYCQSRGEIKSRRIREKWRKAQGE